MARVLVTETISERGLARLREAGHEVDVRLKLSPDELKDAVKGAAALVIRSETRVTAEVLDVAGDLVAVGRAGIGIDNIDVDAATRRGVMVVNAPSSNVVSAAEHAMALLLAMARNIPQAHNALVAGSWERSRWEGVELHGKVLGVVGIGRVGALVAQRASAFGMRLMAYDPFVSAERARQMGVELVGIEELMRTANFVTIHLPRTPDTMGLIGERLLAMARPGMRIVNTARGGIIDEAALDAALRSGQVAGAALDVFVEEPTTESPLFELDSVVATPHLGASTREAQDKAGETIAEQVLLALSGGFVPYAVNISAAEASETVRPYLPLAERLGRLFSSFNDGVPEMLEIDYQGHLADHDTRILTLAVLKGLLAAGSEEPVSYVNAPQLANEHGVVVRESKTAETKDFVNLLSLRGGVHSLAGTLFGLRNEARIVIVDGHVVDIPPTGNMVFVRNDDRPGMIGAVGSIVGGAGINISDMDVGVSPSGEAALMVLSTDQPLPDKVLEELLSQDGIFQVHSVSST